MIALTKVIIALLPFATLVAGFLIFRLSAVTAALWTWIVEFVVVLTFYRLSPVRSLEACLWGTLTMWSVFLLLWSGQLFGYAFRATGLIDILLESVDRIFPAKDKRSRGLTTMVLLSGFVGTFNIYAVYPIIIPGLAGLGFDGIQAASAYLVYASWCIPFAGLFVGTVIASAASHLPFAEVVHTSGLFSIPFVFVSVFGAFRILGFRLFDRTSQGLYWLTSLSSVAGIILFTQIWPTYHNLTLISGALITLTFLFLRGRSQQRKQATGRPVSLTLVSGLGQPCPWPLLLKAYAPLLIGIAYSIVEAIPAVASDLNLLGLDVAGWGFSPVAINLVSAPALPIFIAVLSSYCFRVKDSNPLMDFFKATRHGASSLVTLLFGSATVYLMIETGQIAFLAQVLSSGGKIAYELADPSLILLGGMAFGQGAPAIFLFSRIQISPAAALHLPFALLIGVVNAVAMGPTNALKPPLIRFAASLVDITGRDGEIFLVGLWWGFVQIIAATIWLFLLVHMWR